ncbi:MAG TPA: DUF4416 family protein [Candidatus Margulisiibacteriota bacterium]|nr:DUF4416 family protein [Candidatus Margulisiibacteriota bacterium]
MGKIKKPSPVKLIVGLIFKYEEAFSCARKSLIRSFGSIDFESEALPFNQTDYYQEELGDNLTRKFLSFKKLVSPEVLSKIKVETNKIEERLSRGGLRQVNLDPGYLAFSKLVLASTKDYAHRIYLGRGIYAEITLDYRNKTYRAREWTYPDYKSQDYLSIFNRIRQIYSRQVKE